MSNCVDCIHTDAMFNNKSTTTTVPRTCRDYKDEMMVVSMHSPHLAKEVVCKNYVSFDEAKATEYIENRGW